MGELDQVETDGEGDEGREAGLRLHTTQSDSLEALELADGLLDPGATAAAISSRCRFMAAMGQR
ncbi:MAG: hypothetical protein EA355_03335 [Rhodobacteraceae bacterium]|nr:MAG: hypothetical protein EA355_03335 [Paracoccaceae bacterium]